MTNKTRRSATLGTTLPSLIHIQAKRIGTANVYLKNITVKGKSSKSVARIRPTGQANPQRTETVSINKFVVASLRVLKSSIIISLS